MHPFYERQNENFDIFTMRSQHYPPHLHSFLECVYLQKGTLAVGQGKELYPMEAGDFALIFPNTIHHYQVFDSPDSRSAYLMTNIVETGAFNDILLNFAARNPVIPAAQVDPEIRHALRALAGIKNKPYHKELCQAYLQIILAKSLPQLELVDKQMIGSHDLVYEVVSYISAHFQEELTLNGIAQDLSISPYVLSRVFSSTFHTNFNTYVNEMRLKYAGNLLKYSNRPITDIAMDSGFSSLRTFNRFCKEKLRMTPREYRTQFQHTLTASTEEESETESTEN